MSDTLPGLTLSPLTASAAWLEALETAAVFRVGLVLVLAGLYAAGPGYGGSSVPGSLRAPPTASA